MAVKTQGTEFWAMDPDTGEIIDIGCVTSIDGIDTSIDQVETTCLRDLARRYEAGLATPGAASFTVHTDPSDPNHILLHQYKVGGKTLNWIIGWRQEDANGLPVIPGAVPTADQASDGQYVADLPGDRAWLVFEGYMSAFPFTFEQNNVVQSNISVQVSGEPVLIPAAP